MHEQGNSLKSRVIAYIAAALVAFATSFAIADNDIVAGLGTCKAIEDESERLTCYDQLATSTAPVITRAAEAAPLPEAAPSPGATPSPDATTPAAPLPLTDDVAKARIEGQESERPEYAAVVTRCEDAKREHRKFFAMENGQVWKQANTGRMSFRDKSCKFDVTLSKDAFGWVMEIPSEKRKIRVKRVR